MSPILSLPLALILVGLPHLPGLPGMPGLPKAVKDIRKHLPRHVAPLDSLPPAWKPAPLLALENQFVRARLAAPRPGQDPWGLKFAYDPRQVRVSFDADSGTVRYATGLASVEVGEASRAPVSAFARDLTRTNFDRLWRDAARQQLQATAAGAQAQARTPAARTGMSFELPSPLPKRVQSLLGPGGPSLNISGSESIRLSGQSDWTNQTIGLLGQERAPVRHAGGAAHGPARRDDAREQAGGEERAGLLCGRILEPIPDPARQGLRTRRLFHSLRSQRESGHPAGHRREHDPALPGRRHVREPDQHGGRAGVRGPEPSVYGPAGVPGWPRRGYRPRHHSVAARHVPPAQAGGRSGLRDHGRRLRPLRQGDPDADRGHGREPEARGHIPLSAGGEWTDVRAADRRRRPVGGGHDPGRGWR